MYIYSVNSRRKIVHTGDCFYGKQIKPANRKQVDTIEAVVLGGFCLCRYCNPVVRQFREEQAQVSALCQEGEMTCRPVRRGILVQTPCSEWLIVPSEQVGGSELYHKNSGDETKAGQGDQGAALSWISLPENAVSDHTWLSAVHPLP